MAGELRQGIPVEEHAELVKRKRPPASDTIDNTEMGAAAFGDGHWAVTVSRNGEEIVTIESNCLSGREISAEDEETIRKAARHLLGFIGDG